MKTPPPPMWGAILEEDFYDPSEAFYNHTAAMKQMDERRMQELARLEAKGTRTVSQRAKILKLKRKVVYAYEYSDPSDDDDANKPLQQPEPGTLA